MNLISAFKKVVVENYANFNGRATRAEYWLYWLATFIIGFVLGIIVPQGIAPFVTIALSLALLLPGLAVATRRLHDSGRSAWNFLWILLPCVGAIIVLVFMCLPSQNENNPYGELDEDY